MIKKILEYLSIPSPSSYTKEAMLQAEKEMTAAGYVCQYTKKGALIATKMGHTKSIAITAHMDTLGGMVKAVNSDGSLTYHRIGGGAWNAVEGENCTVITRSGKKIRGSILPIEASSHIYGTKSYDALRTEENMRIRLDEEVFTKQDVLDLGISVGDILYMDTRTELSNGYLKSRYIDNKAAVGIVIELAKNLITDYTIHFIFSNYEECGHGLSSIPEDTDELIAIDIAPVGSNQNSDEYSVSIAARDKKTPYDYDMISALADTSSKNNIPFNIDVFNHYSSDASQYVHRGGDVKFACIGPGVTGTHHYERTHTRAIKATYDLLYYYCSSN